MHDVCVHMVLTYDNKNMENMLSRDFWVWGRELRDNNKGRWCEVMSLRFEMIQDFMEKVSRNFDDSIKSRKVIKNFSVIFHCSISQWL